MALTIFRKPGGESSVRGLVSQLGVEFRNQRIGALISRGSFGAHYRVTMQGRINYSLPLS